MDGVLFMNIALAAFVAYSLLLFGLVFGRAAVDIVKVIRLRRTERFSIRPEYRYYDALVKSCGARSGKTDGESCG